MDLETDVMKEYTAICTSMGQAAKQAAATLQLLSTEDRNDIVLAIADTLKRYSGDIVKANELDMKRAKLAGISTTMLDRLRVDEKRISEMVEGVRQVAALEDPIGGILETIHRPNGLMIEKKAVPLGVVAMIYEARPNVTVDAAVLCLKSGNAAILRGGKEAMETNKAIVAFIQKTLVDVGLPPKAVQLVPITDRAVVPILLKQREYIDVAIPRGGAGLIQRVVASSTVPVIETGSGVCHIYVDEQADYKKVLPIIINAKVQRPSVCNAVETLLIHRDRVEDCLLPICEALGEQGVIIYGDTTVCSYYDKSNLATDIAWSTEYNDLMINIKVVDSLTQAIEHINTYGTHHSECIITEDEKRATVFMNTVDAAVVYVNASTRFTDGFEFGFGAEIGISTQKLHSRGPMGLQALTSYKYYVHGKGQIR